MKIEKTDNQKRYKDFYKVGTVSTGLGTYNLYLEMNQDWVDEYQKILLMLTTVCLSLVTN